MDDEWPSSLDADWTALMEVMDRLPVDAQARSDVWLWASDSGQTCDVRPLPYGSVKVKHDLQALSAEWLAAFRDIDGDLPPIMDKWHGWRDDVHEAWTDLYLREEARRRLERRYFDGRGVVMPEPAERLALLREGVDCQLGLCVDLPTFHGLAGGIDDYQAQAGTPFA